MNRCSNATAVAQEAESAFLWEILSDLSLDLPPTSPAPAVQGQADPRWLVILDRRAKGRAAFREIARRHGAPGRLPSRTPAAANDDTASEPVPVPDRVTKLVTERTRRRQRKSGLRQRADARKMRAHAEAARGEAVVDHTPTSHPSTKQKITASNSNAAPTRRQDRALASWEHAGELPQIIATNRALDRFGVPFAFSLNIHPDLIQAGNDNARGILNFLRRRFVRVLKRELGRTVTFWIMIETDKQGRPHCHGGIAMNDNEAPAAIERALAEVGGHWTRQGSRCADVRRQWQADGWAAYPAKAMAQTRRHLREAAGLDPAAPVTLWSCTNELRAAAKEIHAEVRRSLDPRSIKIDVMAQTLASIDDVGMPLDRKAAEAHSDDVKRYHQSLGGIKWYQIGQHMHPRLITDETAADLIDSSNIAHRIAHGAATLILGTHRELGAWTLMQTTTRQFYVTSERDPADLRAFLAAVA